MHFSWNTLYVPKWFCKVVQCICSNNSPGSLGRMHEMLEMAGIHCTSPISSAESYCSNSLPRSDVWKTGNGGDTLYTSHRLGQLISSSCITTTLLYKAHSVWVETLLVNAWTMPRASPICVNTYTWWYDPRLATEETRRPSPLYAFQLGYIHYPCLSSSAKSYDVSVPTVHLGHWVGVTVGHMKYWKWQGYTVQVQSVLPNDTMCQFQQSVQVTGSDTWNTGNGRDTDTDLANWFGPRLLYYHIRHILYV
jgi:hypothetical protein